MDGYTHHRNARQNRGLCLVCRHPILVGQGFWSENHTTKYWHDDCFALRVPVGIGSIDVLETPIPAPAVTATGRAVVFDTGLGKGKRWAIEIDGVQVRGPFPEERYTHGIADEMNGEPGKTVRKPRPRVIRR